jgi:hypothetical protein
MTCRNIVLYLPRKAVVWVIFFIAIIYALYVFRGHNIRLHSTNDMLYNFAFKLFIIHTAYSIVAWLTSSKV